ncbi:hypothetical protein BKA70DRAFT_1283489, partial [Coprinopsis sp. MPI-PUGE-AT-0042]
MLPTIYLQALILAETPASLYEGTESESGKITKLSLAQQQFLIQSHARLSEAVAKHQLACLSNGRVPHCLLPVQCAQALRMFSVETWTPAIKFDVAFNTFDGSELADGVCGTCRAALETQFEGGKDTLWAELPKLFGLPPWDDLENLSF